MGKVSMAFLSKRLRDVQDDTGTAPKRRKTAPSTPRHMHGGGGGGGGGKRREPERDRKAEQRREANRRVVLVSKVKTAEIAAEVERAARAAVAPGDITSVAALSDAKGKFRNLVKIECAAPGRAPAAICAALTALPSPRAFTAKIAEPTPSPVAAQPPPAGKAKAKEDPPAVVTPTVAVFGFESFAEGKSVAGALAARFGDRLAGFTVKAKKARAAKDDTPGKKPKTTRQLCLRVECREGDEATADSVKLHVESPDFPGSLTASVGSAAKPVEPASTSPPPEATPPPRGPIRANVTRVRVFVEQPDPDEPTPVEPEPVPHPSPVGRAEYFIGNLPRAFDAKEGLVAALKAACGAKLHGFKLLLDENKLPNGCAVVSFSKGKQEKAAVAAIAASKVEVDGRPVRIEEKQSAAELTQRAPLGCTNTVFAANVPLTLTESQLRLVFRKFGRIEKIAMNLTDDGTFNGTARITYDDPGCVAEAVRHSGTLLINRRPIRLDLDKRKAARSAQLDLTTEEAASSCVIVIPARIGAQLAVQSVKELMQTVGKVKYCRRATDEDRDLLDKSSKTGPNETAGVFRDGSVTVGFTSSACVALALQLVGRQCTVEGSEAETTAVMVKVLTEGARSKPVRPDEITFAFNGGKLYSTKDWVKSKRIEELEVWNSHRGGDDSWHQSGSHSSSWQNEGSGSWNNHNSWSAADDKGWGDQESHSWNEKSDADWEHS
ncbi:hypothetical protein DIPPA_21391 [Diplonema papillatum]|nr:hypothetical protein DIPPA_21391 [Diplonema papillatum]